MAHSNLHSRGTGFEASAEERREDVRDLCEEDQVSASSPFPCLHPRTFSNRQLSKGHFSDDNQKRLTGLDVEIPIYEAKMTGDTRLVVRLIPSLSATVFSFPAQYQVDCIPEFESSVSTSPNRNAISHTFWVSGGTAR